MSAQSEQPGASDNMIHYSVPYTPWTYTIYHVNSLCFNIFLFL